MADDLKARVEAVFRRAIARYEEAEVRLRRTGNPMTAQAMRDCTCALELARDETLREFVAASQSVE